jgi:hypothetical protein
MSYGQKRRGGTSDMIGNIFNKRIAETFPNLEKEMYI